MPGWVTSVWARRLPKWPLTPVISTRDNEVSNPVESLCELYLVRRCIVRAASRIEATMNPTEISKYLVNSLSQPLTAEA